MQQTRFEDGLGFLLASCVDGVLPVAASLVGDYLLRVWLVVTRLGKSADSHRQVQGIHIDVHFAVLMLQLDQNHTLTL